MVTDCSEISVFYGDEVKYGMVNLVDIIGR